MNAGPRPIQTARAPAPASLFSQGFDTGSQVYVSGQLALDPERGRVPEDVGEEARLALAYVRAVVEAAGLTVADVVRTTIYVTSFDDYRAINDAYGECFAVPYPARATVQVAGLLAGARVEIDAVAVRS